MLGQDQRWQNGFDCQGLWVEVKVERELGFTSKQDIEAYGIAEFVRLCKQRVLTYAAVQTEQSIRLGYWMDWNDPDELRRLRDLLAEDPSQVITVEGPHGPVTDTVEMIVGRLGLPELGGSYFTFCNENNDLIWGFLAECHRRGWLYKGIDSMPWCARCGTGMSQMEMNEGYQDREDPGLTVRFPLVDRPGEYLLVWTTTPWTLTANVAAAVGPRPRLRPRPSRASERYWVGKGHAQDAPSRGRSRCSRSARARTWSAGAIAGPSTTCRRGPDGLRRRRRTSRAPPRTRHRVIAWDEVGEDEGTGIVHIAPGGGAEDFQLGKQLGPAGHRAARRGGPLPRRLRAVHAAWTRRAWRREIIEALEAARLLLPPRAVHAPLPALLALRDGAALPRRRRVVHLHGPGLRRAPRRRSRPSRRRPACATRSWTSSTSIRWIPGFGYERELDWLHTMSDWMISKKRYWGLALPIWECATCERVRGRRRARGAARARDVEASRRSRAARRTGPGSTRS